MKPFRDIPLRILLTPVTYDILVGLHCFFANYDDALLWLKTENLNLGGFSPMTLINMGRAEEVQAFINISLDEGGEL